VDATPIAITIGTSKIKGVVKKAPNTSDKIVVGSNVIADILILLLLLLSTIEVVAEFIKSNDDDGGIIIFTEVEELIFVGLLNEDTGIVNAWQLERHNANSKARYDIIESIVCFMVTLNMGVSKIIK